MPINRLDPDLYNNLTAAISAGAPQEEALQRAYMIQEQRNQSSAPGGNFLTRLARTAVSPFERVGRQIGGATYELARGMLNPDDPTTPYDERFYDPQTRQVRQNPFLPESVIKEKFSDIPSALIEGAKTTAGLASYGIPLGRTTSLFGRAVGAPVSAGLAKSFVLPGAVAAGLFETGQPRSTPLSIGASSLAGGATAGAMGVLARGLGLLDDSVQKSIVKPKVSAKPGDILQEERLVRETERLLGRGSADTLRRRSGNLYNSLKLQVDDILGASSKKISKNEARRLVENSLQTKGSFYNPSNPSHVALLNQELDNLFRTRTPTGLTPKNMFDFKINLGKKLGSNAFRRTAGELGSSVGERAGVQMDLWHSIDDIVTNLEPSVKQATETMSTLWKIAPGLQKSSQRGVKLGVGAFKGRIPGGQVAQSITGRASGALGAGATGPLSTPISILGGQVGKNRLLNTPSRQVSTPIQTTQVPQTQATPQTVGQVQAAPVSGGVQVQPQIHQVAQQQLNQSPYGLSPEVMFQAALMLSPDEFSRLETARDQLLPGSGDGVTAGTQKRIDNLKRAVPVLRRLAQYTESPSGVSGFLSSQVGRVPGVEGGKAEFLRRENEGFARLIANVFAGETGVATDEDVRRWQGLLPQPGDTASERVDRMNNLVDQINLELFSLGIDPATFGVSPDQIGYGTIGQ